ncbi:hypothetical protein, partial [Diaphorobacter sp.]|uniref:hypothetical protein n=1 Tax=Diaphorobacter sp. TaxID=1934310 RepID=UPI00289F2BF2
MVGVAEVVLGWMLPGSFDVLRVRRGGWPRGYGKKPGCAGLSVVVKVSAAEAAAAWAAATTAAA